MRMTTEEIRKPNLTPAWRKYYLKSEVNRHLSLVAEGIAAERDEGATLEARALTLEAANRKLTEALAECEAKTARQEALVADQAHELGALGEQLSRYREESIAQSEKAVQQDMQLTRLQARVEQYETQVRLLESRNTDDLRAQALREAEQTINRAVEDSERILQQATQQRSKLITACRSAYYGALQFKQNLAAQFCKIEQELDASIDTLQHVDNTPLALGDHPMEDGTPDNRVPVTP